MPENDESQVRESTTVPKKRTRLSLVWIIPIVAAVAGAWVAVTRILGEGPKITILLQSAEGLDAGKTQIHYNGVNIGTLTAIRLSDDHRQVIATAQMAPKTDGFLVEDTEFWVVRPRISGANISGLGTLISGSYVGMEIGHSQVPKRDFVALDTPPVIAGDVPGRFFVLKTPELGSLDSGTPIYFRRLQVGQVASYSLDPGGDSLSIKVFVKSPYDQYVSPNTRFWQASGVDVSLTASGLTVQTQSVLSILIGGIAFETSAADPVLPAAEPDTVFKLFKDRADAFAVTARDPQTYVLVFNDSVRGLAPGAPVEFRGIPVGEVAEIDAQVDPNTFQFSAPVTIRMDAARFGIHIAGMGPATWDTASIRKKFIDSLVTRGVRAQLRTGNLLTGALYVAFDFFPDAPPATVDWDRKPVELPTIPGQLQEIEANVGEIIKKLNQVPFKGISDDLQRTLAELDQTLVTARGTFNRANGLVESANGFVGNANTLVQPNSALSMELGNTLQEVSRAARGLRVLADYLERHPEALIRGKPGEAK